MHHMGSLCAVLNTIYLLKFKVFLSNKVSTMQELVNAYNPWGDSYIYPLSVHVKSIKMNHDAHSSSSSSGMHTIAVSCNVRNA